MLVAFVRIKVAQVDIQKALDELRSEIPAVHAMSDCLTFNVLQDSNRDGDLIILHEWEGREDFDAYIASTSFAGIGTKLKPLLIAPPISRRFDARMIE